MRTDLSMAMVCMVNSTYFVGTSETTVDALISNITTSPHCHRNKEALLHAGYKGSLAWTTEMQSLLFSGTYFGSVITAIPGGILADRVSPQKILLLVIANYVLTSMLTPSLAKWNFYAYFISRIFMGFGEGFVFPTLNSFAVRWFPQAEKGRMIAIYTSGNQIATAVVSTVGAHLCPLNFLDGWPLIFYLFGTKYLIQYNLIRLSKLKSYRRFAQISFWSSKTFAFAAALGILWMIVAVVFLSSTPHSNRWISEEEKNYIYTHITHPSKKLANNPIPWRAIATSTVMYANLLSMSAMSFTASLLLAFLPTYNRDVLMLDIKTNGTFTTITFFVTLSTKVVFGILSDKIKKSGRLSHTATCKLFQVAGNLCEICGYFKIQFFN
uniref:MFS domain-containing protein n=1 Tax=Syphacia muris TaxID=451379 RepID=A0A0N5AC92_9BILA